MSFSTVDSDIVYLGDDVDNTFEIPYHFQKESQIYAEIYDVTDPKNVITTSLIPSIDYVIINDTTLKLVKPDVDGGGQPIFVDRPLLITEKLRIFRDTQDIRTTDYQQYEFPRVPVNIEMDKIHQRLQELRREVDRAIKLNALALDNGETLTAEDILDAIAKLEDLIADLDKGSTLPSGGLDGDFIERASGNTAEWRAGSVVGFSTTLNRFVTTTSLLDTINTIYNFQYRNPNIAIAITPAAGVREKGVTVTITNIAATYSKTSNDVEEIAFWRGNTQLARVSVTAQSGTENHTLSETVTADTTYRTSAKDDVNEVFATSTYKFVYPYFYGVGAAGLVGDAIKSLGKDVRESTASIAFTSSPVSQRFYFAQPASYPQLVSILDQSSFETIGSYTMRTTNVNMLDGTSQSYRVYELNNDTTQTAFKNTFKR